MGGLARMLLFLCDVNQTMEFQGTDFRQMKHARGVGRASSSVEKFGDRLILIGGRLREGMSGQRAAAGGTRGAANVLAIRALSVTTMSHSSPFPGAAFRQSAGCRPVSHPVAATQNVAAHTCESTTTKALEFAVANPAVTGHHGRVCGGRRSLT